MAVMATATECLRGRRRDRKPLVGRLFGLSITVCGAHLIFGVLGPGRVVSTASAQPTDPVGLRTIGQSASEDASEVEATVSLAWSPAAGCLSERRLRNTVGAIVGYSPFGPRVAGRRHIEGTVREGAGSYEAILRIDDGQGEVFERRLLRDGTSCAVLDEPLAVVLSFLVDSAPRRTLRIPPASESSSESTDAPTGEGTEHSPEESTERRSVDLRSVVGAAVTWGLFPETTWGLRSATDLGLGTVGIRFSLAYAPRREMGQGDLRGRYGVWLVGGGICLSPSTHDIGSGAFRWRGCLEGSLGQTFAVGRGDATVGESALLYSQGALVLEGDVAWGPFLLRLGVRAVVPFVRPYFYFQQGATEYVVHRAWPIFPAITLAVGLTS